MSVVMAHSKYLAPTGALWQLRQHSPSLDLNCLHNAYIEVLQSQCKQISGAVCLDNLLIFGGNSGAGEGIRTLDPNLGKVVLYP